MNDRIEGEGSLITAIGIVNYWVLIIISLVANSLLLFLIAHAQVALFFYLGYRHEEGTL